MEHGTRRTGRRTAKAFTLGFMVLVVASVVVGILLSVSRILDLLI